MSLNCFSAGIAIFLIIVRGYHTIIWMLKSIPRDFNETTGIHIKVVFVQQKVLVKQVWEYFARQNEQQYHYIFLSEHWMSGYIVHD